MKKLRSCLLFLMFLSFLDLSAQETIQFEYYQRLIFVKLSINKTDSLLFLLDTGANGSAIDSKTADRLRLKEYKIAGVEGSAGSILVPSVKASSVSIGKSRIKNISFTKYDLGGSLSLPGKHLDGILGTDFLKHFVITIDFKSKNLIISRTRNKIMASRFPFKMDNGIPAINITLNNKINAYFRYDSGASLFETDEVYLNVTTKLFNEILHNDPKQKPVSYLSGTGIGGEIQLPVYQIDIMNVGNLSIKKPYLIVQPEQGYFGRADAVGFFSNNLLEKFSSVTLDFISKNMYFIN